MSNNEYMREYVLRRYHRRREEIINRLGGECVHCGSSNDLQIDHIDPSTKKVNIGRQLAGVSQEKLEEEVKKCQLLCEACHTEKTISDLGNKPAKGTHGTLSSYRYCKCEQCRKAKSDYNKAYKTRKLNG